MVQALEADVRQLEVDLDAEKRQCMVVYERHLNLFSDANEP
jgi:hypothetical protein